MAGANAYSFDRLEDIFISLPTGGEFSFQRTYYSSNDPWLSTSSSLPHAGGSVLNGVPCPFGASRTVSPASLRWTHNLFSFVDQTSTSTNPVWVVRPPNGNHEEFGRCDAGPCWAPSWAVNSPGQTNRLLRTTEGFEYHQNDGKTYVYGSATADAGQFYITALKGTNGTAIATITYQQPYGTCPVLSTSGVPYVHQVTLATGQVLTFGYGSLGSECVLASVVSNGETLAEYQYEGAEAGLLSQAQTPTYTESFQYDGGLRILRKGALLISHAQEDSTVGSSVDPNGAYSFSSLASLSGASSTNQGQNPCAAAVTPKVRTLTDLAARGGDGGDVSAGFTQAYVFGTGYAVSRHSAVLWSIEDSCTTPYACSPGTTRWTTAAASSTGGYSIPGGSCNDTTPGVPYGYKDKRDNWFVTPQSFVTFDGGARAFEVRAHWKGVPSSYTDGRSYPSPGSTGQNALETVDFTYTYDAGTQGLLTEVRPSALATDGGVARTTYRRDSNNRVVARFESGLTMSLNGALSDRVVATFITYNADGVPTTESGPCEVENTNAESCPTGSALITHSYFGSGEGLNSKRLQTTSRYASTATLVTTYGGYTVLGDPGFVTDENGITTTFTYQGHNVASKSIAMADGGAAEWEYAWDNEKLASVRYPEGNYEVYCYRSGATPTTGCTGTWTGKLQMMSKASSADGGGWAESIVYQYWPDGTVRSETRYENVSASAVPRFHQEYAADAHRRPTLTVTGTSGAFSQTSGFDGANNREAVGPAYNQPPAFCRSLGSPDATAGALSRLCAQMGHDRANRLRQLDLFADASSSTPIRACIDYDRRGNVSRVTTGCGSGDTCSMDATPSTCASGGSSAPGLSHDFATDDFGNVVEVQLSGTDNGSGARGVFRFEYDARGNLVRRQTAAQRASGSGRFYETEYDRLGRQLTQKEYVDGTPYTVLTWAYDADTSLVADPPGSCGAAPLRTIGRIRAVRDPLRTRWYQYDWEGRVISEIRRENSTTGSGCGNKNHLSLEYSLNGNLTKMHYGFGREVTYVYGVGAQRDRISGININTFVADGGSEELSLIGSVQWEPYGGLRSYDAGVARVEFEKGQAESPTSQCPTAALAESVDQTDRLRSIRVSAPGRELYRRTYTWRADEVARVDTCYLGGPHYYSQLFGADGGAAGYDGLGQVKVMTSTGSAYAGLGDRQYSYDARGNILGIKSSADGGGYTFSYDGGSVNTRDWLTGVSADDWNRIDLEHDRDGRTTSMMTRADSSGNRSGVVLSYDTATLGPGADTTFSAATLNLGRGLSFSYLYYYDAMNRRIAKEWPLGERERYFYDLDHQLLEVESPIWPGSSEIVWLAGLPIAVLYPSFGFTEGGAIDGEVVRYPDPESFVTLVVTDHIGHPVVFIDQEGRINGASEYDPYGNVNRVPVSWQTDHPYTTSAAAVEKFVVRQHGLGLELGAEFHFPVLDTEQDCYGNFVEGVSGLYFGDLVAIQWSGGHNVGDTWVPAYPEPEDGGVMRIAIGFGSGATDPLFAGNAHPTDCEASGDWPYSGFVLSEYRYNRSEYGASFIAPVASRLGFPGQLYDEETGLYENWHRYYSSALGRYLSPEPLMQSPDFLRTQAQQGFSTPAYAYARNNPLSQTDPTGLSPPIDGEDVYQKPPPSPGPPAPSPSESNACPPVVTGELQWPSIARLAYCTGLGTVMQYRCRQTGKSIEQCIVITNRFIHKCAGGSGGPSN